MFQHLPKIKSISHRMENLINHNKLTLHVMEMQWITGVRQVFGYQVRYFDIHCTFGKSAQQAQSNL